jgi:hypothetical protein
MLAVLHPASEHGFRMEHRVITTAFFWLSISFPSLHRSATAAVDSRFWGSSRKQSQRADPKNPTFDGSHFFSSASLQGGCGTDEPQSKDSR